jgi:hypothetical protein
MRSSIIVSAGAALAIAAGADAAVFGVTGGQTNVALNLDLLESAANLTLVGVSGDVINPGNLPDSVAFPINARTDTPPTTATFDDTDFLGTYAGVIEHIGVLTFEIPGPANVDVGDFTIGFDPARAGTLGGLASGFFVESTVGIQETLFDLGAPSTLVASSTELTIGAEVLVSPEFGQFLFDNSLSSTNLQGAAVGDALVEGVVPTPGVVAVAAIAGLGATRRRR